MMTLTKKEINARAKGAQQDRERDNSDNQKT